MYAVYGEPGDLRLPSDGPMPIAKEPVTITDILIGSLHRKPEFGVDTEIQHISTPPAQETGSRHVATYSQTHQAWEMWPRKHRPVLLGVGLGSEKGKLLSDGPMSANIAVLYCRAVLCQVGPTCQTPLSTQTPLGILTSFKCFGVVFFFFSPELRHEEEKDVFSLSLLLSLCYLSGLSVW